MKKKLVLALIAAGLFSQVNSAEIYVEKLDKKAVKELLENLENSNIMKSPKVALATGPNGGKEKRAEDIVKNESIES